LLEGYEVWVAGELREVKSTYLTTSSLRRERCSNEGAE
jgi:hypothetical protein